jgi:hypothetical protein
MAIGAMSWFQFSLVKRVPLYMTAFMALVCVIHSAKLASTGTCKFLWAIMDKMYACVHCTCKCVYRYYNWQLGWWFVYSIIGGEFQSKTDMWNDTHLISYSYYMLMIGCALLGYRKPWVKFGTQHLSTFSMSMYRGKYFTLGCEPSFQNVTLLLRSSWLKCYVAINYQVVCKSNCNFLHVLCHQGYIWVTFSFIEHEVGVTLKGRLLTEGTVSLCSFHKISSNPDLILFQSSMLTWQ